MCFYMFFGTQERLRRRRISNLGAILGASWALLGPPWGHLGAILGHLRAILGHLGAILGNWRAKIAKHSKNPVLFCLLDPRNTDGGKRPANNCASRALGGVGWGEASFS